jgi:hypothetical protein
MKLVASLGHLSLLRTGEMFSISAKNYVVTRQHFFRQIKALGTCITTAFFSFVEYFFLSKNATFC